MEIGNIRQADIDSEMRSAYLDYAMSVIISRALPDVRDGLKPVHRRILYAMHDMGIRSNTSYKKSARIVGEVLGKYHPHGDMAVYESMARMAQDFSMRYMFVDGQGNFGSVDGDSPAAMRYTEARLDAMAEEMLVDIDKNTVDFVDNFDGSLQEPTVLPSRLPSMLINGASGIAVGMATNIPPHNLVEVSSALDYIIDNYDDREDIAVEDLMKYIKGPDFPTGGIIVGREGIVQAYSTGKGKIIVRGKADIKEIKAGRYSIVITEIPYQVNKSNLIERIADLVRGGRIDSISDLRDESDRNGMSIYIELKRGAQPKKTLNQLFKYTPLQSTYGIQILALLDGEPRVLPLKKTLMSFLEHRQVVITRRTEFELEKAKRRAHILEGLLIALANLDDVIQTIRESPDADEAKTRLMTRFNLTDVQAQAILDMQLRRLAALERQKIEDEHKQVLEKIAYLEGLLADPKKILELIKEDLTELDKKYGDDRRTRIIAETLEDFSEEDLVADEPILISITQRGYIKRVSEGTYKTRGRGRRGVTGQSVKDEDEVLMLFHARTLHNVLFFSDKGKVYSERAFQIPEATRTGKGVPIINVISLDSEERITAAVTFGEFKSDAYCIMATQKGKMKRVPLSEFESVRHSGMLAMKLSSDDSLGWVRITSGNDDIITVTASGKALRFSEKHIRSMGRQAAGVTGIKLLNDDRVTSMEVVEPGGSLLVITENGFGKRTLLNQYSPKGRATQGQVTIHSKYIPMVGKIIDAKVVQNKDEVTLISSAGLVVRMKVTEIRTSGRGAKGLKLMNIQEGDSFASLARIQDTNDPLKETNKKKKDDEEPEKEMEEAIEAEVEEETDDALDDEVDETLDESPDDEEME